MAKEKFERTKPHLNVGTIGHTQKLQDTAGQLTVDDSGSDTAGNPAPSSVLTFGAPVSSTPETATVGFPVDTDFVFDPNSSGPALSIDFQLDVLANTLSGTPQIDITMAILQDGKSFIASRAGGSPSVDSGDTNWINLGQTGFLANEFHAVGGGLDRVDFSQAFQFFYAFSGNYSTTALSVDLGLDNMLVEITTIPEPTSIALACAMGAALLWSRLWNGDDEKRG
jgi:hypothetical protein